MLKKIWLALWQFFSRMVVMVGVPLLAWGWDDLPEFFANPARCGYLAVVTVQALIFAWLVYRTPPEANQETEAFKFHWYIDLFELIFILAAYGDRRSVLTWNENALFRWIGFTIYLSGVGFSSWANITWINYLRREADRACEDSVLISEGPFRWVRHPAMLAVLLYGIGSPLLFRSWVGLVLVIPLVGSVLYQVGHLEEAYTQQYQRAWEKRCQASKRLIPFIY